MADPIGPNLTTNGTFEAAGAGPAPASWTISGLGRLDRTAGLAGEGTGYFALGADSANHGGTIQQTIATQAGKTYTVTFKSAVSWQPSAGNVDAKIKVDALAGATLIESQNVNLPFTKAAGWGTYSFTFTATSAQTTLKFTDTSPNGQADFDVGLDAVSVREAAPRAQVGEWGNLLDWPLIGLHAVVTQDGKVLTFGTTGIANPDGSVNQTAMIHDLWDPVTGQHQTLDHTHGSGTDIFCSAAIILPGTNQILIGGGDLAPAGNQSNNDSNIFDGTTHAITSSPEGEMNVARWYPSMISLPTGQIVIVGGTGGGYAEIFTAGEGWRNLEGIPAGTFSDQSSYPRAWVGGNGEIFFYSAGGGANNTVELKALDASGDGSVRTVGNLPFLTDWQAPAIMYDAGKTLIMASNGDLWTMDITGATPAFAKVGTVGQYRGSSNMTVLADGSVLINGGSTNGVESGSAKTALIWDPDTSTLISGPDELHTRVYHGASVLLTDGSVLSVGSGSAGSAQNDYLDGQIYKPPYLFDANGNAATRPVVSGAPTSVEPGDTFIITVDNAAAIREMTFVKNGATTHTFNMDARSVDLTFRVIDATHIEVTVPDDVNAVTAGSWMLFAWNDKGVPAMAPVIAVEPTVPAYDGIGDVTAEYFAISSTALTLDQVNLDAPAIHTERVTTISESSTGAYYPGGPADDFGVRFKGDFNVDKAGAYTFYLTADDGVRLKIDGVLITQTVGTNAPQNLTQTVNLTAGEHKIELVHIETGGPGLLDLDWSGPGYARTRLTFDGADDNLITNGTFNKVGLAAAGANQIEKAAMPGWQSTGNFEVWTDGMLGVNTAHGNSFLEVDAITGTISQSVKTETGKVYSLSFDVAGRPEAIASSKIEVVWNNTVIGTVTPANANWEGYSFQVTGTGGTDQLAFRSVAGDTDGSGGLLDGVVLKPTDGSNGETPPGPAVNLLTGGNIESASVAAGDWGQPTALAGWTSSAGKFEIFGDGLLGLRSTDGGDMAEIGADTGTMSQSVKTEAGRAYGITFDLAGRPDGDGSKIEVLWNGQLIDSFVPAKGTMTSYHTHAVGTGGNDVLAFRTAADSPEGLGGVLDNVELKASSHPVDPEPPVATNLLANGALESAVPAGDWGQPTALTGWTSSAGKFEIWGDGLLGARSKDGGDMVEIGTDTGTMSQSVKTEAGRAYGITFDLAGRPDGDGSMLEVLWNGVVIDTITPTKGTMASYHTHAVGTGGNDVLAFRTAADSPEGLGGLLDTVVLKVSDHALTTAETASHDAAGHTPIAFDLDGDGRIAVTGATSSQQKDPGAPLGRTVQFDIDGDGDVDTTEWLAGSGDGLLVDTSKIGPNGAVDGKALFGDEGGAFANGYDKLKLFDADGDGQVAGAELAKLGLWIDDGDAKLEEGEMKSAADSGIASISTDMKIVLDAAGAPLMQSSAFDLCGHEILTEDVWFATASHDPLPEPILPEQHHI